MSGHYQQQTPIGMVGLPVKLPSAHPFRKRYELRDVWNAMATTSNFDYVFWMHITLDILIDNGVRYFGYILVTMAYALITVLGLSGLFIVLPRMSSPGIPFYVQFIIGCNIWFCVYFNYFFAATTKAGCPQDYEQELTSLLSETSSASSQMMVHAAREQIRLCKKCNYPKPARCHHCSVCNQCVMRMDHHCPWLSNCVGLRNYRYFIGFLFYVVLGTSYLSLMSLPLTAKFLFGNGAMNFNMWPLSSGSFMSTSTVVNPHQVDLATLVAQQQASSWKVTKDSSSENKHIRRKLAENQSMPVRKGQGFNRILKEKLNQVAPTPKRHYSHPINYHLTGKTYDKDINTTNIDTSNNGNTEETTENESNPPQHMHRIRSQVSLDRLAKIDTSSSSIAQQEANEFTSQIRKEKLQRDRVLSRLPPHLHFVYTVSPSIAQLLLDEEFTFFLIFMVSSGVCVGVGVLLSLHLYLISKGQTTIEMFENSRNDNSDNGGGSFGVISCFCCGNNDDSTHDTTTGSRGTKQARQCRLRCNQFIYNLKRLFGAEQVWQIFIPRTQVTLYIDELETSYYQPKINNSYNYQQNHDNQHPNIIHRSGGYHNPSSYFSVNSLNTNSNENQHQWTEQRFDHQKDLDV